MNQRAIRIIESYISRMRVPRRRLKKQQFAQRSYSLWAAEEVLHYVKCRNDISPTAAVEEFIRMMDEYSCINPETSYLFSVAKDTALDIYDHLITKG